jgi:hypothetical protein
MLHPTLWGPTILVLEIRTLVGRYPLRHPVTNRLVRRFANPPGIFFLAQLDVFAYSTITTIVPYFLLYRSLCVSPHDSSVLTYYA